MCDAWAQKDARIRVIHKENAGAGLARNTGLEQAAGAYICFCDSDDYMAPVTVENALVHMKKHSAQVVVFGMCDEAPDGSVLKKTLPESAKVVYTGAAVQQVFLPDLIDNRHRDAEARNLHLSFCTCLLSAELVKRSGWKIVSERQYLSEDSYSLLQFYRHVEAVAVLPESNYHCCVNENSLSRSYREDQFLRFKQFYRDCQELAAVLKYDKEVQISISALFLSFSIGLMKQIAASGMDGAQKRKQLRKIVNDKVMHQAIADVSGRTYGKARAVLFWAIRHRYSLLCSLLLTAQNNVQKAG